MTEQTLEYDIVIIGSGAGGGTVAKELAPLCRSGCRIALLEWGGRFQAKDNTRQELPMAERYYFDAGGFQTRSQDMTLAFARAVGGSTTVYTGTSLKAPADVFEAWAVPGIDAQDLAPRYDKYIAENNVHLLEAAEVNENNRLFLDGCRRLGWRVEQFPVNVKGCRGLGTCNLGCAVLAKQGTSVVQIPAAERQGVEVIPFCRVHKLQGNEIHAEVVAPEHGLNPSPLRPGYYRIKSQRIVVSAGAVNSPALLLRSFGDSLSPALGRYFTCHPAMILAGDIKRLREDAEGVRRGLVNRGQDAAAVDRVLDLDRKRRELLTDVETLKNERNKTSKEIGARRKSGEDTSAAQASVRELGNRITALDGEVSAIDASLKDLMLRIPNVPYAGLPVGKDASANRIVRQHGEPKKFDFEPLTHMQLGETLGILDFARATRLSASGFALFVGLGSRLQRALIQFMLDLHVDEHGYTEVWPPSLCNADAMTGTGQLPKMAEDMYRLQAEELYLIPTAEVPVTNIYRDEIIRQPLPIYLTAYTPCFRREAGAAGKETRGLIRLHQFDKVEMVKFVEPHTSYDELESLLKNAEDVLQRLGLCYRILELCTGDISFAAAKCYDIELWAPGQREWLEVSSCSNFEDFQARRASIRYKNAQGKTEFVHTLNGSGVALARLVVAILENGQQPDGSVVLPEAIVPYMGGVTRIERVTDK